MNKKILFLVILFGLSAITLFLYFATVLEIDVTLSVLVLAVTAWVIATQAFATEETVKNQVRPAVDVSMIYNAEKSGTRFQFLNITRIPAYVWITLDLKIDCQKVKKSEKKRLLENNEYLIGQSRIDVDIKSWITAPGFLKKLINEKGLNKIELIMRIDVAPMFNEKARSPFQEKSYKFNSAKKEWIRTPFWGIADPLLIVKKNENRS